MDELRERIADVIVEAAGTPLEQADHILAIPEIAEALSMKRTVDGIKAGRLVGD